MTGAQKAEARSRAQAAGRPYPNIVDNMAVARKTGKKRPKPKSAANAGRKRSRA